MPQKLQVPLIVLIGFMGAGKSLIGRLLAQQLGCPLIDLDVEIARAHGSIPELFSTQGESGFRTIEQGHLELTLQKVARPSVIALGGGAFMQEANRELLLRHQSATVVFLDASFEVVRARIADTGHQRPLARDLEGLRKLFEQRRPTYLLAHHTFDASAADPAELLSLLVQLADGLGFGSTSRVRL